MLGTNSLYDMQLDLEFKADESYQDNRLINYNLTGQYKNSKNKLSIDTAISALNTKQVISKVAKGRKGIALTYRNDPIEGQINTAVSFVFDTSGSMGYGLRNEGRLTPQMTWGQLDDKDPRRRMTILKAKAKLLGKSGLLFRLSIRQLSKFLDKFHLLERSLFAGALHPCCGSLRRTLHS